MERVGDILLTCSGGAVGTSTAVDVSVNLSTDVTNATDTGSIGGLTAAKVIVNGNDCASPAETGGVFGACGAPDARFQHPQAGVLTSTGQVTWFGVHLPTPGVDPDGSGPLAPHPLSTTLRISGLRTSMQGWESPVFAFVSVIGPAPTPVSNNVLRVMTPGVFANPNVPDAAGLGATSCTAAGAAQAVNPDGTNEVLGAVVLECINPAPSTGGSTVVADFVLETTVDPAPDAAIGELTEAVLIINGNYCGVLADAGGSFDGCEAPVQDPQRGVKADGNRIVWRGVHYPAPVGEDCFMSSGCGSAAKTVLQIQGVRGNIAELGGFYPSTQVQGVVSLTGIPITQAALEIGVPVPGASSTTAPAGPGGLTCLATAVPPLVRTQGVAELVADVALTCTTIPGTTETSFTADFYLTLDTAVTNNIGYGQGAAVTDAVLVMNENNSVGGFDVTPNNSACAGQTNPADGANQCPQLGVLGTSNQLQWKGVRVAIPAGGSTSIRFSSMRADASVLGMQVYLASTGSTMVAATPSVLNVAVPIAGVTATVEAGSPKRVCRSDLAEVPVAIQEGFASSFTTLGTPAFAPLVGAEAGYFAPGSNAGGGASQSTRLRLRLEDVPSGVTVEIPREVVGGHSASGETLKLTLVEGADALGAGGAATPGLGSVDLSIDGGSGEAFYEVVEADPFRTENIDVPVIFSWSAGAAPGQPKVRVDLAPLAAVFNADADAPEPRFVESSQAMPALNLNQCTTELLFPHVTSQSGADTRVVVSNTSGNSTELLTRTGACTLHYQGRTSGGGPGPADQTSDPIAPGEQLDLTLSSGGPSQGVAGAPDFAGYLISECDFEGGAAKAIVSRADGTVTEYVAERIEMQGANRGPDSPYLVFPWVTSQDGRDTEIVIANTTLDWLGTQPYAGSCSIRYYGENAPAWQTTTPLSGGDQIVFNLSTGSSEWGVSAAPNFEGHLVARCEFDLARGQASIIEESSAAAYIPQRLTPPPSGEVEATALLGPYVTSRDGFETWVALANSSSGVEAPADGSCVVSYHGDNASPVIAPQVVALNAGAQLAFALSEGDPGMGMAPAPGFRGSLSVNCDVPHVSGAVYTRRSSTAAFAQSMQTVESPRSSVPAPVVYPFLDNRDGGDTVIVLVNTSQDSFGTPPQDGVCQLAFAGESEGGGDGPAAIGVLLEAGEPLSFDLSRGVPDLGIQRGEGFRGYLYADCSFPLASGLSYMKRIAQSTAGVFRPSTGGLFLKSKNEAGFADKLLTFGLPGDKPVTGDWDGDDVDTIGVFRDGVFLLRNQNTSGFADLTFAFGVSSDLPVVGDWDGDGVDTIGAFRDGLFLLRNANDSGPADAVFSLGIKGDVPISGDWNGDGIDTVGVFRPSNGALYLKNENATGFADMVLTYGIPGDKPLTGDWNLDGIDTIGVFRNGVFYLRNSNTNGFAEIEFGLGIAGDEPISGNWGLLP